MCISLHINTGNQLILEKLQNTSSDAGYKKNKQKQAGENQAKHIETTWKAVKNQEPLGTARADTRKSSAT